MTEHSGLLHGDEPIASKTQDLLGRAAFAARIARDVLNAPVRRGFVISIMGDWGSGKTSVLRLVEEDIGEDAVSLWFNPWMFSSAEELVSRFFAEVAAQLEGYQDEEVRNLAARVASYGEALAPLVQIFVPGAGTVLSAGAEAWSGAASDELVSTRQRYEELSAALAGITRRVVVYIDDIDRLREDEIREVMRLVKLVGDLPNVVYVLAYDRARVEKALAPDGADAKVGRAYLEKIVQVPHSLPPIRASSLHKIALNDLNAALGDDNFPFFDEERWGELFRQGIAPMITTLRDARRFANVASLVAQLLREEVTGEDLLALEALHVFEPDVHAALPKIARLLTRAGRVIGDQQAADAERREEMKAVLENARDHEAVSVLLRHLFPAGGYLFGGGREEPDQRIWRQARRVASSDVLDVYLHASFGEDAIATSQVLEVVEALADAARVRELLGQMPDESLSTLLDRVQDYRSYFAPGAINSAPVFLDLFPRLRIGPNFSLFPPEWAIQGALHSLFAAAPTDRRPAAAVALFEGAPSLTARWYVTMWCEVSEDPRKADEETKVLSAEAVRKMDEELRGLVGEAEPESLCGEQQLLTVLLHLVRDNEDDEGRRIAREKLDDDELLLALLANALQYADWFAHLQRLTGIEWLSERISELAKSQGAEDLTDNQARALSLAQRKVAEAAGRVSSAD